MFAPKVAKPQTKAAEASTIRLAPHRSTLVGLRLGHDPVEQMLFSQRTIGNQAILRLLARRDSALSKEAEVSTFKSRPHVAPALRAPSPMRLQRACSCGAKAAAGGMCENCQHKQLLPPAGMVAPASVQRALAEPGESLRPRTRARMERRFGFGFGAIRIHPGDHAARLARDVGARAYTVGRDIVFGAAEYRPGSARSDLLLAHELVHTIQQGASRPLAHRAGASTNVGEAPALSASRAPAETLSRKNMFECRGLGVPCPPAIGFPEICSLIDCIPSATANLPFAISPGVCVYQCDSGRICVCVLVGSKESAICTFRLCSSGTNVASADDINALVAQAVAMAGTPASQLQQAPGDDKQTQPPATMQAKLTVGAPNDRYEQEADMIAARVMRMLAEPAPISAQCASPAGCGCGRSSPLTESPTHPELIDRSVAQRQPEVSDPAAAADEASLPAGAPPDIEAYLDPVPDDAAAQAPQSATNGPAQLSLKRSVLASSIIQRQAAAAPPAAAASPVVPKTLSWSDFPPVPSRINGKSARTGFVWTRRGTAYTLAFNPATSWSVQADQTALLLRHEQYHLNLAALIINKANAAVGTMGTAALDAAVTTALATHTASYDGDTDGSRNARLQTAWEQDIDAGVPEFPIAPVIPYQ